MINGQLMVQDSWLKINELLDGREEIKIRFRVQGSRIVVKDSWFMVND